MGVIKSYVWCCDLCKRTGNAKSEIDGPVDWVKITVEDTMTERLFHDKCICSKCIKEIELVKKKQLSGGYVCTPGGGSHVLA